MVPLELELLHYEMTPFFYDNFDRGPDTQALELKFNQVHT